MKSIFIYSNSFFTYEFINVVNHLLNFKIDKINLLEENHNIKEFKHKKEKIKLYNNVDQCIENSDVVFVLNNSRLPLKPIISLRKKCDQLNKDIYCIDFDKTLCEDTFCEYLYDKRKPVILNISIGNHSANFCVEILLNKIFSDMQIEFFQEYNLQTKNILKQIRDKGILNKNLCINNYSTGEICIKSVNCINFQELIDSFMDLKSIDPDYIILNTNYRWTDYDKIKAYIGYTYGVPLFIIKSNFAEVYRSERSMKSVYCEEKEEMVHYINDENLEEKLNFDICSRLSFPNEVYII